MSTCVCHTYPHLDRTPPRNFYERESQQEKTYYFLERAKRRKKPNWLGKSDYGTPMKAKLIPF
ncbi:unnamed protein product [Orchesella dallaii]|uniref:Uncharacterized protein n=1 Tax=Orchesella dallaii TaxID=48710 RepID=A0ABP1S5F6_9HEXA